MTSYTFHLDENLKQEAFSVFKSYGLTPAQAFNLFLTEIAQTKTLPLDLTYLKPNATTLRAMKDAESGNLEVIYCAEDENAAEALLKRIPIK